MQIKETCEACGLTRKAVVYYEQQALIHPRIMENGYRVYDEAIVARLKEIMVLRQCGLSLEDIRGYLESANKPAAMQKLRGRLEVRRKQLDFAERCLQRLSQQDRPEVLWQELRDQEAQSSILDRLTRAFPGAFGRYLAYHFGRFLNGPVDSEDKRQAYRAIVEYLDGVPEFLSEETAAWLEQAVSAQEQEEQVWSKMEDSIESALQDMDAFLDAHQDVLDDYLAYKSSPDYAESVAGKMQREMLAFQSRSGYQTYMIENLRKLSPEYDAYLRDMEKANQAFIRRFPQAEALYPPQAPKAPAEKPKS